MRIRRITAIAALALAGCGTEEDRIKLVSVTGTVTQNNKPLGGATITFMPEAGNAYNTPGVDSTGPEGNYKVMFRNRSGVSPGKYKVTVEPSLVGDSAARVPDEFKDDPYMAQMALGVGRPSGGPKKVAVPVKNEFDADVDSKGGTFDFDVKGPSTK